MTKDKIQLTGHEPALSKGSGLTDFEPSLGGELSPFFMQIGDIKIFDKDVIRVDASWGIGLGMSLEIMVGVNCPLSDIEPCTTYKFLWSRRDISLSGWCEIWAIGQEPGGILVYRLDCTIRNSEQHK